MKFHQNVSSVFEIGVFKNYLDPSLSKPWHCHPESWLISHSHPWPRKYLWASAAAGGFELWCFHFYLIVWAGGRPAHPAPPDQSYLMSVCSVVAKVDPAHTENKIDIVSLKTMKFLWIYADSVNGLTLGGTSRLLSCLWSSFKKGDKTLDVEKMFEFVFPWWEWSWGCSEGSSKVCGNWRSNGFWAYFGGVSLQNSIHYFCF